MEHEQCKLLILYRYYQILYAKYRGGYSEKRSNFVFARFYCAHLQPAVLTKRTFSYLLIRAIDRVYHSAYAAELNVRGVSQKLYKNVKQKHCVDALCEDEGHILSKT